MDPRIEALLRMAAMQQRGGSGGGAPAGVAGFFAGPNGELFEEYAGSEEEEEDDEDEEIDLSEYLPKPLEEMSMEELKAECKKRDLPVTGSRKTLEGRIFDSIEQEHMVKAFEAMGLHGFGGDGDEGEFDDEGEGFTLEELMGMPRAEELDKDDWLKLWLEVDTNLREDGFLFTSFQRGLNPRLMEVSMPYAEFGKQLAAALATMQDEIDNIAKATKKPYAVPASKLAAAAEKVQALKEFAASAPTLMKSVYDCPDFDEKFPNEAAAQDYSVDRVDTFGASILAARCGAWKPTAAWRGQMLLRANPITQCVEFDLFRYAPSPIPSDVKLAAMRLGSEANTATGRYIFQEMERFEVSRVLQMRLPFQNITRVALLEEPLNKDLEESAQRQEAILVLDVDEAPKFFTRRLNTQASMMNEWRPRGDFTLDAHASKHSRYVFLGQAATLRDLVSSVLAQCPTAVVDAHASEMVLADSADQTAQLKELLLSAEAQIRAQQGSAAALEFRQAAKAALSSKAESDDKCSPAPEIIQALVDNGLLDDSAGDVHKKLNSLYGPCFYDFLTFHVKTADDLKAVLNSELTSGATGILDLDEFGGETVLHFLKHQKKTAGKPSASENQFYSFCQKQILEKDDHHHCDKCRNCCNRTFWHCNSCNKCSDGEESQKKCIHCGVKMGSTDAHFATANKALKPRPWPLSRRLDKSGHHFMDEEDDEEEEPHDEDEELVVSDDSDADVPHWAPPVFDEEDEEEDYETFGDGEGFDDVEDFDQDDEPEPAKKKASKGKPGKKVTFFEDIEDISDEDDDDEEEEEESMFESRRGPSKGSKKAPANKKASAKKTESAPPASGPFAGFSFQSSGPAPAPSGGFGSFGFDVPPAYLFSAGSGAPAPGTSNRGRGGSRGARGGRGPRGRL